MTEKSCPKCDYSWNCKSGKLWVCCPNCMRKFNVEGRKRLTAEEMIDNFIGIRN